jgi:cytidine deaminase
MLVTAAAYALAAVHSYPGNEHPYAAAVLTRSGRIYTGINVTHSSAGPCAEPIAIGAAVGGGAVPTELVMVVVVMGGVGMVRDGADGMGVEGVVVVNPCGRCRQLLLDVCPGVEVVVVDEGRTVRVVGVRELLPFAYSWRHWELKVEGS